MRHLATDLSLAFLACLLLAACGSERGQAAPPTRAAAPRAEADRAEARRAVRELEAAIDEAHRFVQATGTPAETAGARAQRLLVSATRRAIVVANVSLQKARTALAGGNPQAALAATAGAVERLKAVREGKVPPAGPGGTR